MRSVILIPIFDLNDQQCDNFKFVLDRIRDSNVDALVVEQDNIRRNYSARKVLQSFMGKRIRYISTEFHLDMYCKRRLIEFGLQHVKHKYVWVNDHDTYCDFAEADRLLWNQDLAQPYSLLVEATASQTAKLLKGIKFKPTRINRRQVFGPMPWIMKKHFLENALKTASKRDGYLLEDLSILEAAFDSGMKLEILGGLAVRLYGSQRTQMDSELKELIEEKQVYLPLRGEELDSIGEIG